MTSAPGGQRLVVGSPQPAWACCQALKLTGRALKPPLRQLSWPVVLRAACQVAPLCVRAWSPARVLLLRVMQQPVAKRPCAARHATVHGHGADAAAGSRCPGASRDPALVVC